MSDTTARQDAPTPAAVITAPDPASTRPQRPEPAVVHLRVVKPDGLSPARRRRRVRLAGTVAAAFVVGVVFALVGLHVMLAQNQFRLDRLNTQAAAEQATFERSRLRVDQLEAPQRIVSTAEGKLGMVPAGPVTYLVPSPLPAGTAPPAAGRNTSTATAARAPTDWTTVKPLLVPNP